MTTLPMYEVVASKQYLEKLVGDMLATRYAWSWTRVWGAWKLSDFIKGLGPLEPFVVSVTDPQSFS